MEGIEQATAAFREAINPNTRPAKEEVVSKEAPIERMFEDGGDLLVEEGDGEFAGGDEPALKPKKAPQVDPEGDDGEGDDTEETPDGEEGEEQPDEDAEEGDEGKEEEDPELSAKFEVIVDGAPTEVTLKEALEGYIRTETFHRRLNSLTEAGKLVQQEAIQAVELRKKYAAGLDDLQAQMKELIPAEPDWDKLFADNPAEAHKLRKQYEAFNGKLNEIKTKREQLKAEEAQELAKNTENYAKAQFSEFVVDNGITNKEMLEKELASMRKTALASGFSEQEVATVYDKRMLTILRKASKYDRIMAAKPKAVRITTESNKKTIVPGAAKRVSSAPAAKGIDQAQRRLAKTGRVDDAAAVFQRMLSR